MSETKAKPMKTFEVKIADLVPSKIQPESRVTLRRTKALAASMEEHGQLQPIAVCPPSKAGKRSIIIGHTRVAAAQLRGQTHISAVELDCTPAQARAIFIGEACSVQKVDAFQWMGVWKQGCPLKELPTKYRRNIEHCQKIFGPGLDLLFEHRQAPTCGKLIHELYFQIDLQLRQDNPQLPTLAQVGEWFVTCNAYQDVQYVSRSRWPKHDVQRILSCIRKKVSFKDALPRGRAPKDK